VGLRETMNKNPAMAAIIVAALIVIALGLLYWNFSGGPAIAALGNAYFTIDDGKTWFAADEGTLPPFQKDGKNAYRCFVFTCDDGATKFALFLQRYTSDAKARIEAERAKGDAADPDVMNKAQNDGEQVKFPGTGDDDKNWVKRSTPQGQAICKPACKTGGNPKPVMP
jgi:hypothetical protein